MKPEIEQSLKDIYEKPLKEGFYRYSSNYFNVQDATVFLSFDEKGFLVRENSDYTIDSIFDPDLPDYGEIYIPLDNRVLIEEISVLRRDLKWLESKLEQLTKKQLNLEEINSVPLETNCDPYQ